MEIKIDKRFFIKLCIVVILCFASFCAGRFSKLRGASEDGIRTEQQVERLSERVGELESELQTRIEQCEQLEGQLESVGVGIDESIRTAGSIRAELEQSRLEIKGSNPILNELRARFVGYENRIKQLEDDLKRVKTGSSE